MRTNPHILEINAHSWLRKLSQDAGHGVTLADISESTLIKLKEHGFDFIWLMGVWKESPLSREIAQNDYDINEAVKKIIPDYKKEDIMGSPYSVYDYSAHELIGDDKVLKSFKKKLNKLGIGLLLDFAGNHLAADHPLTFTNPDLFVRSLQEPEDKNLFFKTKNEDWLSHGKDPYFPPWTDTAQLNYFNPETRKLLTDFLLKIASLCDGVRCDMAMLSLNKIFRNVWGKYVNYPEPSSEFWNETILKIRDSYPHFLFIAEVYWGLEWEIQEMGFDYTYDKTLYDRLLKSSPQDIQGHLNAEHLYQMRSLRFTANHDEESPLSAFGREKSFAAATIAYTIPGARLFTFNQICGTAHKLPIQYIPSLYGQNKSVLEFYEKLLKIINHPCFHGGQWFVKKIDCAQFNDNSCSNILAWVWTQLSTKKIILVNYGSSPAQGLLTVPRDLVQGTPTIREELSETEEVLKNEGIVLNLKPFEIKIISVNF